MMLKGEVEMNYANKVIEDRIAILSYFIENVQSDINMTEKYIQEKKLLLVDNEKEITQLKAALEKLK